MLTFGKKLNFRPLLIALFCCLFFGYLSNLILLMTSEELGWNFRTVIWSALVGILVFLFITLIYYPNVLQDEFNYFTISDQEIIFYDYGDRYQKFKLLFLGNNAPKKHIKLADIKNVRIVGKNEIKKISFPLPFDMMHIYFMGIISMHLNPFGFELELVNGQKIYLSIARDRIYHSEDTSIKATEALNMIKQRMS